jgi:hypothetical protein
MSTPKQEPDCKRFVTVKASSVNKSQKLSISRLVTDSIQSLTNRIILSDFNKQVNVLRNEGEMLYPVR